MRPRRATATSLGLAADHPHEVAIGGGSQVDAGGNSLQRGGQLSAREADISSSHTLPRDPMLLAEISSLAIVAGTAILEVYRDGPAAERKADGSPVTEADRRAEAIILEGLALIAPGVPVVAEEEASAGRIPQIAGAFFLVDPLDGTKEFIRGPAGGGEFTVNIALLVDGAPVVGVVYAPALGKLWRGGPAGAESASVSAARVLGALAPIRVRTPPEGGITAVASRSHRTPETDAYLARYPVAEFRPAGSSLKFCAVAEGSADLYPRLGPTMEWDTAAGDAVLRAAGGRTVTLDGTTLVYGNVHGMPRAYENPSFVALGGVEFRAP
jgi:3'(2'),5'-bisphosphate nucleotidase